jgi:hypothetical protein
MVSLAFSVKCHSLGFQAVMEIHRFLSWIPQLDMTHVGKGGEEESVRNCSYHLRLWGVGDFCEQTCPTSIPATLSPSSSIALSLWLAERPSLNDKLDQDDPNKQKKLRKNYFCWHLEIH